MKITLLNELFPIILPLDFRRSKIPISFRYHSEGIQKAFRLPNVIKFLGI